MSKAKRNHRSTLDNVMLRRDDGTEVPIDRLRLFDTLDRRITQGWCAKVPARVTDEQVAMAFRTIRDQKLYREKYLGFDEYCLYETFEEFCRQEFGFSRVHAHRLCEAAEIVEMLPIGNKPTAESVARPLAKLPDELKAKAWADAVASAPDGDPTAKDVKAAVERITTTQSTPKQYRCPSCHHDEQTDDGDCAKCYEPPKRKGFDESAANERLFDLLDAERKKWPAIKRAEFYEALRTYVEQMEAA